MENSALNEDNLEPEEQEPDLKTPENEYKINDSDKEIIEDYINAKGIWEFFEKIPNFSYLGDIVETIIHARFPPKPRNSFPPGPHYFPLKISILGPLFSGQHTVAKHLETRYGLKFFEVEKILEDRNKAIERKQDLEEGKKPKKAQEDESEIFLEECINCSGDSSKEKARLVRAKLRGIFGDEPKIEEENKKVVKKDEVKCQG